MVRRILLVVVSLSLLCVPSAQAASIFLPDIANDLTALAFNPAGDPPPETFVIDLVGTAVGTVFDTVTSANLGNAVALSIPPDPGVGADLQMASATDPPAVLGISFVFASATISGELLMIPGTGTGVTSLNPTLAGFVGPVLGTFSFLSSTPSEEPLGSFDSYQLVSIVGSDVAAIPEPASLTLLGIGLVGAAVRRRKMRG
jgi:hypothetical protein